MRARIYDPFSISKSNGHNNGPYITIGKTGCIFFNAAACQLMNLTTGSGVVFIEDLDHPGDFYVHETGDGFILSPKTKSEGLYIQHLNLARKLIRHMGLDENKTYQVDIAPSKAVVHKVEREGLSPVEGNFTLYGILTGTAKIPNRGK